MLVKSKEDLARLGQFVKVAVDIATGKVAGGCELHVDCAEELMENGSRPEDVWGANVYPAEGKIDYVSLINIRPQTGNRKMEITLPEIREKVRGILEKLL